jgi:hypothetical protein
MTTLATIAASASPEVPMNENFTATSIAGLFGVRQPALSALTWAYYGGVIGGVGAFTTVADGTLTLSNNTTNYVEVTTGGSVSSNTTGFTAGRQPLYEVVTSAGAVTSYTDRRVSLSAMANGPLRATTLTIATGTITTSTPGESLTQTWNSGGTQFIAQTTNITDSASASSSLVQQWQVNGSNILSLRKDGLIAGSSMTLSGTLDVTGKTKIGGQAAINSAYLFEANTTATNGIAGIFKNNGVASDSVLNIWNGASSGSNVFMSFYRAAGTLVGHLGTDGTNLTTSTGLSITGTLGVSGPTTLSSTVTAVGFSTYAISQAVADNTSSTITVTLPYLGQWLVTVSANGGNLALMRSAIVSASDSNVIPRVTALDAGTDFNLGNVSFNTFGGAAVNSFSAGSGGKFDVIADNTPSGAGTVNFYITCMRIA